MLLIIKQIKNEAPQRKTPETCEITKVSIVLCPILEMELREKILTTAIDMFFRFGIKRITMDDISREVGISKKTLYQSFKDKDEMVDVLSDLQMSENIASMQQICDEAKDPIQEIMNSAKHMAGIFSRINPVFFYDLKRFYPSAWAKFEKFKEEHMTRILEQNMRKGVELGIYRADLKISLMARYRLAQFDMALDPTVFPPEKNNLAETQVLLLDHFMHGITTLKGHKLINKYKELNEDE